MNPPCGHKGAVCVIGNYWTCKTCEAPKPDTSEAGFQTLTFPKMRQVVPGEFWAPEPTRYGNLYALGREAMLRGDLTFDDEYDGLADLYKKIQRALLEELEGLGELERKWKSYWGGGRFAMGSEK